MFKFMNFVWLLMFSAERQNLFVVFKFLYDVGVNFPLC